MKIGCARYDITPSVGVALCGQPFSVVAEGVRDPLYAHAMCLDDGTTQVLLVGCDVLLIPNGDCKSMRAAIHRSTGIPVEHVIICATHTHSGPSTEPILGADADDEYLRFLHQRIVDVANSAWRNRSEGRLFTIEDRFTGYAFNRRFITTAGTIETHPLKGDPHVVRPEGPDSTALRVLYSADGNNVIRSAAVNFGCHATVLERTNRQISADYPGRTADYLRGHFGKDLAVLFLQGAAGNICQVDQRDIERKEVGSAWADEMGTRLGERVAELMESGMGDPASGRLRVTTNTVRIRRRSADPDLVSWARNHTPTGGTLPRLSDYGVEVFGAVERNTVSLEALFRTEYWADFYAEEILRLEEARSREPDMPMTITVVAQDTWALVALPCELFVEWGERIYDASPFPTTAVVTLANGWCGYVPTRTAFERAGGYETKEVTSTMLVPEAGDILLSTVLELLEKSYAYPS